MSVSFVFAAGVGCGLLLARGTSSALTQAPPVAVTQSEVAAEATLVRGLDTAAARPIQQVDDAEPGAVRDTRPVPRAAPDIAREALAYAVSVGSGAVYGAGILLDRRGHVLTCNHVVEGRTAVEVTFASGDTIAAEVVERDAALDLALLKLEAKESPPSAHPAPLAGIDTVRAGDDLFSMGAPRKMRFSLGRGMATYVGRAFDGLRFLQTDLPLNGGSSGGPVIDAEGRVVGISSFVLRDSEGIAFALPIDYAVRRFQRWLGSTSMRAAAGGPQFEAWVADLAPPR